MLVDAILCNYAEAVNNQLYIAGGGIDVVQIPAGMEPPLGISLAIGIIITIPWSQTDQRHDVDISLLERVTGIVRAPTVDGGSEPISMELSFNLGRSPDLTDGDHQHVCLAANLPGLPIPAIGKYELLVRIDGQTRRRLPFRVTSIAES
ncbi:DUF6941 family protein [Microlunatus ginsengisoli]|uniref:Uncharacterized protein n=1 Tax=Microlunatus ginsengisoli TaxID=363863 RepID=A0ABP7AZI1_9ACTN